MCDPVAAAPSPPKTAGGTVTAAEIAVAEAAWWKSWTGHTTSARIAVAEALNAVFAVRSPQGTEDGE